MKVTGLETYLLTAPLPEAVRTSTHTERPDDLRREAAMYREAGYRTLKVKVGGLTPEADAERVGVIRKAVGKDVALMLDANQGWNLPTALRAAELCADHQIFWLEDPMPWYDERQTLRRLKDTVDIPIAAGETRDPLWFELFRERPAIVDGFMAVPKTPGLGLELREETLEKYGVKIG
jgi:L-alanine-DL-glutamate epimerase-like enolase superfamily enzyme